MGGPPPRRETTKGETTTKENGKEGRCARAKVILNSCETLTNYARLYAPAAYNMLLAFRLEKSCADPAAVCRTSEEFNVP